MKRITLTTIAGSVLLAAGCAHKDKNASYQSNTSYPSYTGASTTYNYNSSHRTVDLDNTTATPAPSQSFSYSPQVNSSVNNNVQSQTEVTTGDTALVGQVRAALNNDTTLITIAPSIQITAQSGTVTLAGNVSNEQQKQTIEHLVKGTSGVVTVNNQLQISPSATGGSSQSSIYSNSTSQVQGSLSSSASPSASVAASTDLKAGDTNQSSASTVDTSLSAASDKSSSHLYSTKDDFSTNKSSASAGASGEASLGSTNSGSFSSQGAASSDGSFSSKNGASSSNTNFQGGASSPGSSSTGSSTNEAPSVSTPATPDSSLGSTNTSTSETKDKDLSATSERPSARVYSSTNHSDYSSGQTGSQSGSAATGSDSSFNLRIRGTTEADQKLADQVRQDLRTDSSLAASMSSVRISIENGKAVLRGSVKSDEDKQQIEKSIQKVTGVTSVENQLRVGSIGSATGNGSTESK